MKTKKVFVSLIGVDMSYDGTYWYLYRNKKLVYKLKEVEK